MAKLIKSRCFARTVAMWRNAMAFAMLTALAMLAGLQAGSAQTIDNPEAEKQVKAAYLFKFGSYVEWPERTFANANSPLQIGVIGADGLADELAQLAAGRTINGHPVTVRKLRREDAATGLNILFVGRSNSGRIAEILASTKGHPTLTVTESDDALAIGSMINFVVVDGKVRFEVAPRTAGQGNLSISARLLAAAYKVAGAS